MLTINRGPLCFTSVNITAKRNLHLVLYFLNFSIIFIQSALGLYSVNKNEK